MASPGWFFLGLVASFSITMVQAQQITFIDLRCTNVRCSTNSYCLFGRCQNSNNFNPNTNGNNKNGNSQRCPQNEIWTQCAGCEPSCDNEYQSPAPCALVCRSPRCQCKTGYVRDSLSRRCIIRQQCPQYTHVAPAPYNPYGTTNGLPHIGDGAQPGNGQIGTPIGTGANGNGQIPIVPGGAPPVTIE